MESSSQTPEALSLGGNPPFISWCTEKSTVVRCIYIISPAKPSLQVARKLIKHRPCLLKENIQATHDRALAMGDDDPLKPDYSRFLRSDKKTSFSNAVPLCHGHLENYSHWRDNVKKKAVTKIQNIFRGKLARQAAEKIAKEHAFVCARAMALEDTRQRIAAEIWKVKSACFTQLCSLLRVLSVCFPPLIPSSLLVSNQSHGIKERSSIWRWPIKVGCQGTHEASQASRGRGKR